MYDIWSLAGVVRSIEAENHLVVVAGVRSNLRELACPSYDFRVSF